MFSWIYAEPNAAFGAHSALFVPEFVPKFFLACMSEIWPPARRLSLNVFVSKQIPAS